MLRTLLILSLLYSPFLLGQREVFTDFTLRLSNPTGFIAPGKSVQIFLELSNPADSGAVLESISGGGYSSGTYPLQGLPAGVPIQNLRASFLRSPLCPEGFSSVCVHEGSFPVNPGESIVLAYDVIQPDAALPVGTEFARHRIRLSVSVDGERYTIYSSNNLVYILTEDGSGDDSAFDNYQIDLPPIVLPSLQVTYLYPRTLVAGSHFNLLASVRNTGTESVNFPRPVFPSSLGSADIGPFLFESCSSACYLTENFSLAPGESTYLEIGKFYYAGPMLDAAEVYIDPVDFSVNDQVGRQLVFKAAAEEMHVAILVPGGGPAQNTAIEVPPHALPELRDLEQAGDQLLLRDPNTGYDWIRLHASAGYAQDEIELALSSNPLLAGYTLAKRRQVEQLVSNYLHARGIAHINLHAVPGSNDINEALYDFIELIGKNSGGGFGSSSISTAGVIADLPGWYPRIPDWVSTIQIKADEPGGFFGTFPRGVMQVNQDLTHQSHTPFATGFWLVKADTSGNTWLPEGRSYFLDDELILPSINIEGERYSARMNFRSSLDEILQLTELSELEPSSQNATAHYTPESGILEISLLRVVADPLGAGEDYIVSLKHLADTVPPLFLIESIQPAQQ